MTTEASHIHRWILEPFLTKDVPATCEGCPETRVFKGEPDNPFDLIRNAPMKASLRRWHDKGEYVW